MNEPTGFDPTMYLIEHDNQITAPHVPGVEPLPPMGTARVFWEHFGRIAPGLVTTAATLLAWGWHEQLPDGSTQPLWVSGLLTVLAAAAGTVSAAKPHGDGDTTRVSFAAGGALALLGIAAWTPIWSLRVLLWLVATAAVYAVCAPLWRGDRRREREQRHERAMAETEGRTRVALAVVEGQARVAEAKWEHRTEVGRVEGITRTVEALVAANEARETRGVAPGDELNVAALLKAAGHDRPAPIELPAHERAGEWRSQETS